MTTTTPPLYKVDDTHYRMKVRGAVSFDVDTEFDVFPGDTVYDLSLRIEENIRREVLAAIAKGAGRVSFSGGYSQLDDIESALVVGLRSTK